MLMSLYHTHTHTVLVLVVSDTVTLMLSEPLAHQCRKVQVMATESTHPGKKHKRAEMRRGSQMAALRFQTRVEHCYDLAYGQGH